MNLAVIGAGLAGLVVARQLGENFKVKVFEKSRGVSGRLATRYAEDFVFDHGAQYFTARSRAFRSLIRPLLTEGVLQNWIPKVVTIEKNKKPYKRQWFEPHYVATPNMNELGRVLCRDLVVIKECNILSLVADSGGWRLEQAGGELTGRFDWVISTAPAPQTLTILPSAFLHRQILESVKMTACFSLMLGFDEAPAFNFDAAIVKNSAIGWLAVNSHKPGRDGSYTLLVQTSPEWADEHIDMRPDRVESTLISELQELIDIDWPVPVHSDLHRWRYAGTSVAADEDYLIDHKNQLAACGDWCIEGRVEAAFLSARGLARELNRII